MLTSQTKVIYTSYMSQICKIPHCILTEKRHSMYSYLRKIENLDTSLVCKHQKRRYCVFGYVVSTIRYQVRDHQKTCQKWELSIWYQKDTDTLQMLMIIIDYYSSNNHHHHCRRRHRYNRCNVIDCCRLSTISLLSDKRRSLMHGEGVSWNAPTHPTFVGEQRQWQTTCSMWFTITPVVVGSTDWTTDQRQSTGLQWTRWTDTDGHTWTGQWQLQSSSCPVWIHSGQNQ